MKVRKCLTAVGAILAFATISAPAMAAGFVWDEFGTLDCNDPGSTSDELIRLHVHLRCGEDSPSWPEDNPIWQKAGSAERGCEVHESLSYKLYDNPPRNEGNPDKKGKGPGKVAEGAAQKVLEAKYDEAIVMLEQLLADIGKSKPNSDFVPGEAAGAKQVAYDLQKIIEQEAIPCVKDLLPQP